MRRLLLGLLLLAALAVGADFGAARLFESRVTTALQHKYDLGERPIVQVRDFPFLPHLVTGRFSAIDLAARDARAEGITLASVEVHLRGVHVSRAAMLGSGGSVRVDRTEGQVELSQSQINKLLADRLQGGSVTIDARGVRLRVGTEILGRRIEAVVTGRLGARNGQIAFLPDTVEVGGVRDPRLETRLLSQFTFDVPVPKLPADIKVDRVSTGPGKLVLAGRAGVLDIAA
jgi:hypothetical protein